MSKKKMENIAQWILRIAVAGEFIGHGIFALQVKQGWISYFTAVGISEEVAVMVLPFIGIIDILLGIFILLKPIPVLVLWMAFWGVLTATIRPIAGEPIWDFVERWTNWGAPLALFFLMGIPKNPRDWWRSRS